MTDVERRVSAGEILPGSPVGSEAELAGRFAVSRGTVRSALMELATRGLVESVPGKGWYVRDPGGGLAPARDRASMLTELRSKARELDADAPFLSEKEVCDRFGLTRHAARSLLAVLEAEGLIVAFHGRGRFVARTTQ